MSLQNIKELSEALQYSFEKRENGVIQIWHEYNHTFIELKNVYNSFLEYEDINKCDLEDVDINEYFVSIKFRFRDWHVFYGDRTDFNDVTSIIVAIFFRFFFNKSSFEIIDIENDFTGIKQELYAREIIPYQPYSPFLNLKKEQDIEYLISIISSLTVVIDDLCNIFNCSHSLEDIFDFENKELLEWVDIINLSINRELEDVLFNSRTNPKWFYYREIHYGISVVKSQSIVTFITRVAKMSEINIINGINGKLFIDDDIKNIIYDETYNRANNILKKLENYPRDNILIPLENISILIGQEHLIFFRNDGYLEKFIEEKELIRQRHFEESQILFKENVVSIEINTKEDSNLFEDLIVELLKKESHIFWARKVAPTNQPDNGRDIICKFNSKYRNSIFDENEARFDYKKLIVQCKTNLKSSKKQSIGKSNVDVADTIFDYKPDGYMIVTNTQITTRLTEYLETIEERENIYIDWWNREDIEERVLKYPELIHKFSQILKKEI